MSVRIYNTLVRQVVPLETRQPDRVLMYTCGPTVHNYQHIGNFRTFMWMDFIRRYLQYRGFEVTYVMNYTDIEDKIIDRANIEGVSTEAVTTKYSAAFDEDMESLGIRRADIVSRATQHIEEMVQAIEGLIDRGVAYEAEGDVWFAVDSFPGYGKLSGRSLDEMRAGERVEPQASKRSPLDFALWKSAKEGEPSWSSPWGPGRPGWHIECSVMSTKYLGMPIDIHGGGADLTFPHHENEIAQAEALAGTEPFVTQWMHCGLVQMEATKMSKSLGNVVLVRDLLESYSPDIIRYWVLMGSYRIQSTFSTPVMTDAAQSYDRWARFLASATHSLDDQLPQLDELRRPVGEERFRDDAGAPFVERFVAAMDDDFNSSAAFATVHDLVSEGNRTMERMADASSGQRERLSQLLESFLELTSILGFRFKSSNVSSELIGGLVEYVLELRDQARAESAFDRADAIRSRLEAIGVLVEDTPGGTRWHLKVGDA
jgi:cysteinyl-tRNA synthetase